MQAPLNQQQRLQSVFFSEGVAFDGQRLNRTSATAPFSNTWCRLRVQLRVWMEVRRRQGSGTAFASLVEPNLMFGNSRERRLCEPSYVCSRRARSFGPSTKLTMARPDKGRRGRRFGEPQRN